MAARKPETARTFQFRGKTYEVDVAAAHSMRIQRDIQLIGEPGRARAGWDSYDTLFCHRLGEYLDGMPAADGSAQPYGCTDEDFVEFVRAAGEAVSAKN